MQVDQETLPGEQYIPSNSSGGSIFLDGYCTHCDRDKSMNGTKDIDDCEDHERCDILDRSFAGRAVEWRTVNGEIICTGYTPMRDPDGVSVAVRDDVTKELF